MSFNKFAQHAAAPLLMAAFLIGAILSPLTGRSPLPQEDPEYNWEKIASEIVDFWPNDHCAHEMLQYSGYRLVSIACDGDYTGDTRNKVLGLLFQRDVHLKEENYRLEKKSGLYLYKLETKYGSEKHVFLKIYVRNARILWPVHERKKPQMAIYVQNLTQEDDLINWQTLGVNLSYGIKPGTANTSRLIEKIDSYGQEIWLAITMESYSAETDEQFKVLEIAAARDGVELGKFLDQVLPDTSAITGVSSIEGSLFMNDVVSLRNLFTELRRRGIHYFLDTLDEESGGYDTARIMSLNAYRSDFLMPTQGDKMMEVWSEAAKKARETGSAILVIDASNIEGREFIKKHIAELEPIMDFPAISELPEKGAIR